jgi:hypothetical protein
MMLRRLEAGALALVGFGALALWLAYPVAPTFDTAYAMVWGHEILAGHLPSFAAYRAPTEHPLWVALGVLGAALGRDGGRVVTLIGMVSLVALVGGLYRLTRLSFGAGAAFCACLLLLSRFHFAFYAAFAYLDVPYLGLLIWAAALEAARPRRGGIVWVLLVLAGLLRPEAWLYLLCYAVWVGREAQWDARMRMLALIVLPALLWGLVDFIVTGHPTFSFTFTTGHAEQLARQRPPLQVPGATLGGLDNLIKLPVLALAVIGIAIAVRSRTRAGYTALACSFAGVVSFVVTCLAGFAVVDRYLAFAAVSLLCFAGATIASAVAFVWRRAPKLDRRALVVAAALAGALIWTAVHFHPGGAARELRVRVQIEAQLRTILASDTLRAARRCGPVSVPNHKLVPFVRLDLGASINDVIARSDLSVAQNVTGGAALVMLGGNYVLYDAEYGPYGNGSRDPKSINYPPAGFHLALHTTYFNLYVNCASHARAV